MDDKDYKKLLQQLEVDRQKLIRVIVTQWTIFLLILIAGIAYGSYHLKGMQRSITTIAAQAASYKQTFPKDGYTPIKGVDYKDGDNGVDGRDGSDGQSGANATSTHTEEKTIVEKQIPGPIGPAGLSAYQIAQKNGFTGTEEEWLASLQGATGATGAPGKTILVRFNPLLLVDECRFLGDSVWQPIEECQ